MRDHAGLCGRPKAVAPGDFVWIRRRLWRVRTLLSGPGLTRVVVESRPGARSRTFLLPADRCDRNIARAARPVSSRRGLAWLAACTARVSPAFTPFSVVGAKTTLFAYQLEPALAVLAGVRRVLIADAVGLGKTVEAAFIIAETIRRRADARVLVLVPAPLVEQWSGELATRFDICARRAAASAFAQLRAERPYLQNPWQGPGVWLASADYLKQPHVFNALPGTPFDLVVIDEAHTLAGHSQRRAAIDAIARDARHVVMLTATPHDGDSARYERLTSLASTKSTSDALLIFRRTRPAACRQPRHVAVNPGRRLSHVLEAITAFERVLPVSQRGPLALICAVFRKRALSSMAAFQASLRRRESVVTASDDAAEEWEQLGFFSADEVPDDEWSALRGDSGLAPSREQAWLRRLHQAASTDDDPKLQRLCALLRRAHEPVVIFTEYRDTLMAVAAALATLRHVVVLHGGLASGQQRQALAAFVQGDADTLVATDVASQGINLQHRTRWVINFDMPWTPMRLEQRMGRVDRIGQTRQVHVTLLDIRHQDDVALRARVAERQSARDAAPLITCARWTRAAEGLAQWYGHQRAMAARWRGPDPVAVPHTRVSAQLILRLCGLIASRVTLVEIPMVTGTGEVVETHLGWTTSIPEAGAGLPPALTRRARVLSARARRRLARAQAARAQVAAVPLAQPGLFDPRNLPGFREDERGSAGAEDSVGQRDAQADVRVGSARLLLILEARK